LEVDKTAKSNAEKDRKVRTSEKRSKDKAAGSQQPPEPVNFESSKGGSSTDDAIAASNKKSGSRKNKTYPTISMTSPNSQSSKKRLSTDVSLPASSMAASSAPTSTTMVSTPSSMSRPVIASSNSIAASSPLYQQMLTPTATSSNSVFSMDASQPADFLNILSQNTLKENDTMQMLMRNMNGGHLINFINGLSNNYSNVVSQSSTAPSSAMVNNNNEILQNYLSQIQRGIQPTPINNSENTSSTAVNSQSHSQQSSNIGQF
jgi:hypothetical protein